MNPTLHTVVREALIADSAVTDLLGQRIYPNEAAQGAPRPYVVSQLISDLPFQAYDTVAGGTAQGAIQLDCYADRYEQAHEVADEVERVVCAMGYRLNRLDLYESTQPRYRVLLEFSIIR